MFFARLFFTSLILFIFSCSSDDKSGEITITSISPSNGVVTGGTQVTIKGTGLNNTSSITIGGKPCSSLTNISKDSISCLTGVKTPFGGEKDVIITNKNNDIVKLQNGFRYTCPWLHNGAENCGAAPNSASSEQTKAFDVTALQLGHGFVANNGSGGAHDYNDTNDFIIGTQSAFITSNGGGVAKTLKRTGIGPYNFNGKLLRVTVKVENTLNAAALQIYVGDSNLSNHYKFSFLSTQGQLWVSEGDWVTFTMPWTGDHVTTAGSPDRFNITDFQLRIVDDGIASVTAHLNEISAVDEQSLYPSGVASFTFDDGFISQWSTAKPLMDSKSYTATAYVIKERIDSSADYLSLEQLKNLHEGGWEIAAHAFAQSTHLNSYTGLASENDLRNDIVSMREWLIANEFSGYDHCAFPKGEFTGAAFDVLNVVDDYFISCRTINQRHRETIPPSNPHKLRVFYITNATTLTDVQTAIDNAVDNKEWIILSFHKIVTTPVLSTEWSTADFSALLDYMESKNISVKNIGAIL